MGITFPNESSNYRTARDKLLQREAALRREMEAVAAEIRALPRAGSFPRTMNSTTSTEKGDRRRCDSPNCFGPVPMP